MASQLLAHRCCTSGIKRCIPVSYVSNQHLLFSSDKSFFSSSSSPFSNSSFAYTALNNESQNESENDPNSPIQLNPVGIQLLAPSLRKQMLGDGLHYDPPTTKSIQISRQHLSTHGLGNVDVKPIHPTEFTLPRLTKPTLDQHFEHLGQKYSQPYLDMATKFSSQDLPPQPLHWERMSGWTRYASDGSFEPVDYPSDTCLTFDVEVMYNDNPYAILATAASADYWYAWVSPWLLGESQEKQQLIPMPSPEPRILIGHNVGYDRARIADEYNLQRTKNRFIDTMALHIATAGLSSPQRIPWMRYRKLKSAHDNDETSSSSTKPVGIRSFLESSWKMGAKIDIDEKSPWYDASSLSSLANAAELHCGIQIDKSARDLLSTTDRLALLESFDDIISYCASDVEVTHKVYKTVLPEFLKMCPSAVSFSGMLTMGNSFLPLNESWTSYLDRAESLFQKLTSDIHNSLVELAENAKKLSDKLDQDGNFVWETDPWLKQLDWTPKRPKLAARKNTKTAKSSKSNSVSAGSSHKKGTTVSTDGETVPLWYAHLVIDIVRSKDGSVKALQLPFIPLLLKSSWNNHPLFYSDQHGWLFIVDSTKHPNFKPSPGEKKVDLTSSTDKQVLYRLESTLPPSSPPSSLSFYTISRTGKTSSKVRSILSATLLKHFKSGKLSSSSSSSSSSSTTKQDQNFTKQIFDALVELKSLDKDGDRYIKIQQQLAKTLLAICDNSISLNNDHQDLWSAQLDWNTVPKRQFEQDREDAQAILETPIKAQEATWPKWYWDIYKTKKDSNIVSEKDQNESSNDDLTPDPIPPKESYLNITLRSRVAPLLLRLRWRDFPLYHSRKHGWLFCVPKDYSGTLTDALGSTSHQVPLDFEDSPPADLHLWELSQQGNFFFKVPHKDGEKANVGSPLSKPFIPAFEDGRLSSEYSLAADALNMNALCSYWTSARDRILNQLVVWNNSNGVKQMDPNATSSSSSSTSSSSKLGMILPQVVTMGTITRRAVEKTWLTASNPKANRLGSELKAMVRAPPGYTIVGADVDSEELWISSLIGDAQFGFHGATAIGWMTLQGTKSAGTDLHSKTGSILGISRDEAKVFNYSRIYGAGVKHAVHLLLKANPSLSEQEAKESAKRLYAETKGQNTYKNRLFYNRKIWFGGSESYLFNQLEAIATNVNPKTPTLECGITQALDSKRFNEANQENDATAFDKDLFSQDYMTSRVNWVVQSSGVDYLHLLIVAMEYLIDRFGIEARYMLSVHDEIRYLVKDEDKYRVSLALQVANLWTRLMFAYKLGVDDLPQACAFFSAIDIDHILRKEVDMKCVTPSNPDAIEPGESLTIEDILKKTNGGSLFNDGRSMQHELEDLPSEGIPSNIKSRQRRPPRHRATNMNFLKAQASSTLAEVKKLARYS